MLKEDPKVIDLKLVPTLDLIDELCHRCSPVVFTGQKIDNDPLDGGSQTYWQARGDTEMCIGLCREIEARLTRRMIREELDEKD